MYTPHYHEIPRTIKTPLPLGAVIKSCGGIGTCKLCSKHAARTRAMLGTDIEDEDPQEPDLMLW